MEYKLDTVDGRQQLAAELLTILHQPGDKQDAIRQILLRLKEAGDFDAVALRLQQGEDFPYCATNGFSKQFVDSERYLCPRTPQGEPIRDSRGAVHLECLCGMVIMGQTDPMLPCVSSRGSFWVNSLTELLPHLARRHVQVRVRGRCHSAGYESVALVPLRSSQSTIGLLQINDHRPGRFTLPLIQFLEELAANIALTLSPKVY